MTIDALVQMAKQIHDTEGWNLGSSSTRETRNQFWAHVIGCAYHGHPVYNLSPDRQWHLKRASPDRPQTDDVATSMPSRNHWDCIAGVGTDSYRFAATPHGVLPAEQIVYAPPVPDGTAPQPPQPPQPTVPSYEDLGGDAFYRAMVGVPLAADYLMAGQQLNDGSAVWFSRTVYRVMAAFLKANGQPIDPVAEVRIVRNEWRAVLGLPPL